MEKTPQENYWFKPTPEMQTFGRRLGRVIAFNLRGCAQIKSEQKTLTIPPTSSQTDLVAAMKEADEDRATLQRPQRALAPAPGPLSSAAAPPPGRQ